MSKCSVKFCRGVAIGRSTKCSKCKTRIWKANHPDHYAYSKLKHRAKERGHEFVLTLEEFKVLWSRKSNALGRTATSLSFDRIDETKGYHFDNIDVITLSQNSRKRWCSFWKNKEQADAAISETSEQIRQIIATEGEGAFA